MLLQRIAVISIYLIFVSATPQSFEITRKAYSFEPKTVPWHFSPVMENILHENGTQNFILIPALTQIKSSGFCSADFDLSFVTNEGDVPIYAKNFQVAYPFTAINADVFKISGCGLREIFEDQPDRSLDALKLAMQLTQGNDTLINYDIFVQNAMLPLQTDMYLDPQFFFGTYMFELSAEDKMTARNIVYRLNVVTNNNKEQFDLNDLISTVTIAPVDQCQHGEVQSQQWNSSLEFAYLMPGQYYISFTPERHLTSDPKLISFKVIESVMPAALVDCTQSKYFCKDIDTDVTKWSTAQKTGLGIGISIGAICIVGVILLVIAAFRKKRGQLDYLANSNEILPEYDYRKLED